MKIKRPALWIAETGMFVALIVVVQSLTAGLTQLITGSAVNFLLIACALIAGPASGLTVALISPFTAKLFGIGPLWSFVPVIALGNAVIVLVFWLLLNRAEGLTGVKKYALWLLAILLGAGAKFAVVYFGIVKIAVPIIADTLKPAQITKFSAMFAWPQLFTALIGGALAMAAVTPVKLALRGRK